MGLELVSSNHSRRVRCSVAVFICWALLVATGLIIYLIYVALPKQTRLDVGNIFILYSIRFGLTSFLHLSLLNIVVLAFLFVLIICLLMVTKSNVIISSGLNETWYLRRRDWQARRSYGINFLELPVSYVIIGHSAAAFCNQKYDCIEKVLEIQQNHLRRDFDDIGPNFLVGGQGWVFEGRGANAFGAMLPTYNRISVSIMFIGDYQQVEPDQSQFNHTKILLDALVKIGVLHPDYTIWGQCQVNPYTISPGRHLIDNLHYLPHWNSSNTHVCLRT